MLIKIRKPSDIRSSEITPYDVYLNRRTFMKKAALGAAAAALAPSVLSACETAPQGHVGQQGVPARFQDMRSDRDEKLTPYKDVTHYNNFYEFGTSKEDPAENSSAFHPRPWSVAVEGEVNKPGTYDLEDILQRHEAEDRIYRLRCVEAWSMVIPWRGFPLADLIKQVEPTGNAKWVAFTTVYRPSEMPGQNRAVLDWPYVEGLRMDEAMNPLTLLATGVYGMDLPNQNGAPLRLVTPWKYGFKSIKSIVKIRFVEKMPPTTWSSYASNEYGFYANVNPNVDHPRWSQSRERRIGELRKRPTLMFNGYADEVGSLYQGMDLKRWF